MATPTISRVATYVRVSTANNTQDTTMQTLELKEYCDRRGWEIAEQFTDRVCGSKDSRPGLNRLLADARRRRFDAVVVYRYDRFARSLRQLVNALGEFDVLGIHSVSLYEGVDTSTPNGRLVFGIFASIAEFERELIRSRVRSGLAAARAKGKRLGRPRVTVDAQRIFLTSQEWGVLGHNLPGDRTQQGDLPARSSPLAQKPLRPHFLSRLRLPSRSA